MIVQCEIIYVNLCVDLYQLAVYQNYITKVENPRIKKNVVLLKDSLSFIFVNYYTHISTSLDMYLMEKIQ